MADKLFFALSLSFPFFPILSSSALSSSFPLPILFRVSPFSDDDFESRQRTSAPCVFGSLLFSRFLFFFSSFRLPFVFFCPLFLYPNVYFTFRIKNKTDTKQSYVTQLRWGKGELNKEQKSESHSAFPSPGSFRTLLSSTSAISLLWAGFIAPQVDEGKGPSIK